MALRKRRKQVKVRPRVLSFDEKLIRATMRIRLLEAKMRKMEQLVRGYYV